MKVNWFHLGVILPTLTAGVVAWFWGIAPMTAAPQGTYNSSWTESDLIRDRYPHHLVDPDRIATNSSGDVIIPWTIAETMARVSVIGVCWLAALIVVFAYGRPRKRNRLMSASL